jgi:menaquinol-cytochrome c reductase iron-sulfur subunit
MGALITAALAVPAIAYLFSPGKKTSAASGWVDAGALDPMPLRKPVEVVFRRRRADGWKVVDEKVSAWVVRMGGAEVYAVSPTCTHLGCAVSWNEGQSNFLCPCHTSAFSIEGQVLSGPAPRPLDRLPVRVLDGRLQIGPAASKEA